jgi:hypothetical protein
MGLRKVFQKKDPTEDQLRESLTNSGITTKSTSFGAREEKFGAFKQYAQERANRKPGLAPVNPYANANLNNTNNPYANNASGPGPNESGSPYGSQSNMSQSNPYSTKSSQHRTPQSSPYGSQSNMNGSGLSNPYGSQTNLSRRSQVGSQNPYGAPTRSSQPGGSAPNPYARERSHNGAPTQLSQGPTGRTNAYTANSNSYSDQGATSAYSKATTSSRRRDYDEESLDLNKIPSHQIGPSTQARRPPKSLHDDNATLDLNELPEEDDLNLNIDELPQEQELNSEDEEIETIKQDIRFVKQESLASTRNTLKMAEEADASATNTLGMLGSQSERLYNAEQNLLLADTQTKIAGSKVSELNRLNRSIFIPAYGNPFNKKSRLRQEENQMKAQKSMEKYMREQNRSEMYKSEQRIKEGITNNATSSELHQKYKGERDLLAAKRYQFENDSEDDEVEKELAGNLEQISMYAKKLKQTAQTMGVEVESQNARLTKIEDDADRLDINVHMNTTRLSNIR